MISNSGGSDESVCKNTVISPNRALLDELDKTDIDQLHKAVLQISSNCFELKKLCATVLVSAGTLISTFLGWHLNQALLGGGFIVTAFFWVLDAQSFYYQRKLRDRMDLLNNNIRGRGGMQGSIASGLRVGKWRSMFNESMAFYLILALIFAIVGLLMHYGLIHEIAPQKPA
jgi:hypothetical protein